MHIDTELALTQINILDSELDELIAIRRSIPSDWSEKEEQLRLNDIKARLEPFRWHVRYAALWEKMKKIPNITPGVKSILDDTSMEDYLACPYSEEEEYSDEDDYSQDTEDTEDEDVEDD